MAEPEKEVPEFNTYYERYIAPFEETEGSNIQEPSMLEPSMSQPVLPEPSIDAVEVQRPEFDRYYEKYIAPAEGLKNTEYTLSQTEQALTPSFDYSATIKTEDQDKNGQSTIKELSQNETFMNMLEKYYTNRVEQGARIEDETNEEYLERFMTNHYRAFLYNDVYLADQIRYLSNADKDTQLLFGKVYSTIEEKAPSIFDGEMDNLDRLEAVGDALWYGGTSISNLITLGVSAGLGTLASPGVGTAAGTAAGLAAIRAGSTSAIRSWLVKNMSIKPLARATVTSGSLSAVENVMQQNVKRMGRIDPKTGVYDPNASPEDLELDYLELGIATAGGTIMGIPEGVIASRKISNFNKVRQESLEKVKEAQKKHAEDMGAVDAVTTSPVSGEFDPVTLLLADAMNKKSKVKKATASLMSTVKDDFVLIDNVSKKYQAQAIEATMTGEVFEAMGRVSLQLQRDLDKIGMLDVLGETAAVTYRGMIPKRGKPQESKITATIAEGLNGIDNLFANKTGLKITEADEKAALAILDESIAKSGISKKDFMLFMSYYTNGSVPIGDITRKSMSTSMTHGARASKLKREFFGEVYPNVDPEMRKILDSYVDHKRSKVMAALETTGGVFKTLDRVRVASLTSQLVTTSRNIMSGGMMVAGQTGVNFLDSAMYQIGRGLQNAAVGNFNPTGVLKGMKDIWADSTSVLYGVYNTTNSQRLIDATMEYTPSLHRQLIRFQADTFASGNNKFARAANGYIEVLNHFNMASDAFFRRSFYMSSLDKRFKKFLRDYEVQNGKKFADGKIRNVMQYVDSGRILDKKMIAGATEDALKMTFAANPEWKPAKAFLSFMEMTRPVSSVLMPFPRFFVNSLRTMYEYSAANAGAKMFHAMAHAETRNLKGAFGDAQREAYAKAAIGTSTLAFFVDHLSNKEDNTPWYDVSGVDIRAMWPLSSYAAAAEFLIDADNFLGLNTIEEKNPRKRTMRDRKMYIETMSGFPVRSGENVNRVLEGFAELATGFEWDSVSSQKNMDKLSEFSADYFGGYLTPLKMVKDVADQVKLDAKQKDIRAGIEDESFTTKLTARAVNSYLPENMFGYEIQEPVPTRKYLLDNAEKMRQLPIARFLGITLTEKNSKLELEMQRIGVRRGDLLPYTGSARLDNRQSKYFGHYAVEGFKDLFGSEEYNTDVNALGVKMNDQEKLNYQKKLVEERAKFYRDYVKKSANKEANREADLKAAAMRNTIQRMQKEGASTKDLSDAYFQLAAYELHHITNDEMKVLWDKRSSEEDATSIENLFKQKHFEAVEKANSGEVLNSIDYLFLKGDNILAQKSFGLALAYLDMLDKGIKKASFGTR